MPEKVIFPAALSAFSRHCLRAWALAPAIGLRQPFRHVGQPEVERVRASTSPVSGIETGAPGRHAVGSSDSNTDADDHGINVCVYLCHLWFH